MSYKITADCNNCGACEPECPNSAITSGPDVFLISSESCTECVGFHGQPKCAAVCPVDACVTDPDHAEAETVLLDKVRKLHPSKDLSGAFPSHFRK